MISSQTEPPMVSRFAVSSWFALRNLQNDIRSFQLSASIATKRFDIGPTKKNFFRQNDFLPTKHVTSRVHENVLFQLAACNLILTNVENTCFPKDSWVMILPWIALMKFDCQRLLLHWRKGNYDNNIVRMPKCLFFCFEASLISFFFL